ncbi:Target of rapamycin complex 2 subunit bit61 [Cytospora mali]|uniref:Target of rapamycin complex 2 subunit bit61 n=1 Tax=Cytospora mali TaxID=578113 RepID=A0A194VEH0_CYTMA|nr:Target of rapamycin complex 2 subunit bit61 [Valsa mali var. pyri (nom. inval.)]
MQPTRPQHGVRAPGSFAPLPQSQSNTGNQGDVQSMYSSSVSTTADLPPPQRPRVRRVESSSSEDSIPLHIAKARSPTSLYNPQFPREAASPAPSAQTPIYAQFATNHPNSSQASLQNFSSPQNFSRPTPSPLSAAAAVAARSVTASHDPHLRNASPLTLPPSNVSTTSSTRPVAHSRKHSQTAGAFEPSLPSISTSNLSSHGAMSQPSPIQRELPASHIAAQAAVLSHQQSQQMLQHSRQRSQTVPTPESHDPPPPSVKRCSGSLNPPVLSLTEASGPRDSGFGSQGYHNGLLGNNAATTAANVVFPRSGQTSPVTNQIPQQPPPPPPPPLPEKKPEKSSKVKLFSRPGKIGTKGEAKDKPMASPSKIGSALSALQRGNFSTTSLDVTGQSFYNMANASSATIRPAETPVEKETKEKKHHFLSRQRNKPKDKEDYHLQLSSAASNSRPTDPTAPSSLYNFNPSSPGPNTSTFKNLSGLDLRHGGRALRHGRKEEKAEVSESTGNLNDWPGPGSLGSLSGYPLHLEPIDSAKYGLNSMSLDDAWPYLRAKLLAIFEGEDLKLPLEDFNRVVTMHLQYCIQRRSPGTVMEDLHDLLKTGFSSLDNKLRRGPDDRTIPALVDVWMHVYTGVTPYMQAVFLPLDQEFAGNGSIMTADQAKDFWGGVIASSPAGDESVNLTPASAALDIRSLVLMGFRDVIILPRYEKLKTIFSRLSLEFLPGTGLGSPLSGDNYLSTSPSAESAQSFPFASQQRPGTAMSLDPSTASYNSTSTTLLGDMAGGRSRGLSNVSYASSGAHSNGGSDSLNMSSSHSLRPPKLTPMNSSVSTFGAGGASSSTSLLGLSLREQNVEDSKQVAEMVGRMLQCMSVLAGTTGPGNGCDEGTKMVVELSRLLKLNWLGRGRTGRNRRGIVGGRQASVADSMF